jgi:membrane protein DedA with SNARE-associated domain
VLLFMAVESTGIPFPGETMLLVAAIYAGTTHHLAIPLVIAAATGAIPGDNLGFWVGRERGYRLLRRYGVHAVLRAWAAFLAVGARIAWPGRASWSSTRHTFRIAAQEAAR